MASLPCLWREAPGRWGHRLHSLCSYMAMFPPAIPHVFIRWLTRPGDVVYDPFSGRGTTALEACLLGRVGYGTDMNPLALLLTGAKVSPPSRSRLEARLDELESSRATCDPRGEPSDIRALFAPSTLGELLWLRSELNPNDDVDRFLLASLAGILHLNADSAGYPRGLTVSMPNTFAMAPRYVRKFIKKNGLKAPKVSPLAMVRARAMQMLGDGFSHQGRAWAHDATTQPSGPVQKKRAKLLLTSPPYLHVMKYGKINWIRLWLLGEEPAKVDHALFSSSSLPKYLGFMSKVIAHSAQAITDDGYICLVIGDVRKRDAQVNLAEAVAESCLAGTGLRTLALVEDKLPQERKVSRIWGQTKGRATKTDRILILGGPGARLPRIPSMSLWRPQSDATS